MLNFIYGAADLSNGMKSFQFKNIYKSFILQKHFLFWIAFIQFSAGDIGFLKFIYFNDT